MPMPDLSLAFNRLNMDPLCPTIALEDVQFNAEKLINIIRDQQIRINELEEDVRNLSNRLSILEDDLLSNNYVKTL